MKADFAYGEIRFHTVRHTVAVGAEPALAAPLNSTVDHHFEST
jgi:hypothetical protein